MNINKLFLSCVVVSLVGVSGLGMSSDGFAQTDADFLAPPVVENVTEISMPDLDEAQTSDDAAGDIDFDLSDINTDEDAVADAETPSMPEIEAPDMAMPAEASFESVDPAEIPDFPELGGGNDVPAVDAPVPVMNTGAVDNVAVQSDEDMEALPSIPMPVAQNVAKAVVPADVVKKVVGESEGNVEAANDYSLEEKYYSSDRGVTTSDLSTPSKADPIKDPAQKLIIVDRLDAAGGADSRFVAAQRALDLRRYSSALHMFEELYSKNPRDQRILMGRAIALQMTGNEEKAIQAYEKLLDLAPKNPKVLVNLLGLVSKQYPAVALERLKDLYEKHPGNAAIAAQMGLAEAGMHNYDSAERYVGIATSIEPDNAKHYYNLAVIYDRNKNYKKAIGHYERALEIDSVGRAGQIKREVIYDRLARLRGM
jgi:Flp pilus assembly protein TadD